MIRELATPLPEGAVDSRWTTVQRLQGGFAVEVGERQWLLGTDANVWRELDLEEEPAPRFVHVVFMGSAASPRVLEFKSSTREGYDVDALVQVYGADGKPVGEPVTVLPVFDRASAAMVFATSHDREIAIFGNAHPATRDPRIVLVGKDAHPIGDPIRLLDTGDSPIYDCFSLAVTSRGFFAQVLDEDTGELHLVDVDASGHVANEVTWPVPDGLVCGETWREPGGVFTRFVKRNELGEDVATEIYRFDGSGLVRVSSSPPPGKGYFRWLLDGSSPLVWEFVEEEQRPVLGRLRGDEVVVFNGPSIPSTATPMVSVDGRLFIVTRDDASIAIMEVRCGALPE